MVGYNLWQDRTCGKIEVVVNITYDMIERMVIYNLW